jgi:hypothetical protein
VREEALRWAVAWIVATGEVPLEKEEPEAFAQYAQARSLVEAASVPLVAETEDQ